MDCQEAEEVPSEDPVPRNGIGLTEFSDEILLNILKFVPRYDLILSMRKVCKKFANLCLDKSLISKVLLSRDYQVNDNKVKEMVKETATKIQELNVSGCYWLCPQTIDQISRCKSLVRLDLSDCRLTSLRLSKMLSCLRSLRSLAIDINHGFDSSQLNSESKATLSQVTELKQTLYTPSYGVVPCCTNLERLLLYFEINDYTRDGTMVSCQLMVGQSSVPHYENLNIFYARLAPGYVNQIVMRLYLAVFSVRVPENLRAFVISIPGNFPESGAAAKNILEGMAKNAALEALQLPKTWVDSTSFLQNLKLTAPSYLNFSRCMVLGSHLIHRMLNDGKDFRSLISLNLSGCIHCLSTDSSRNADDDIDWEVPETLVSACPNLQHLNLTAAHHHSHQGSGKHLCAILAKLKNLHSLALPVCSISDEVKNSGSPPAHSVQPSGHSLTFGFKKNIRIGVKTYHPKNSLEQSDQNSPNSSFRGLLEAVPFVYEIELIGSSFSSSMPRNEPAIRKELPPCPQAKQIGDEEVAWLSHLKLLKSLTLAQLPGILNGAGLLQVGMMCKELRVLSLANLGMLKKVTYMPYLIECFKHCKQLKDLRLEQPYISANIQFFQALTHCVALERLCIISRNGTFQPDAVMLFMEHCCNVIMLHMFMGETLVASKNMQQALLQRFKAERPALNVVIYPLLHEGLADVIRDVPLTHLDEITLFKSRVAEEPPKLWW
ncbi:F-box/LRR-repeat protein 18 isoform X1 [Polypterus senegalus]|uniref:F-box/LRR-repeat protein 18 isoform X1 n=1 Tax=Polypterus senegalus TaxID=55291 RepID=UPI001962AC25|nr:F-box/LRR-repeat protein 18 isoform X1 [Polypterus senegalus]